MDFVNLSNHKDFSMTLFQSIVKKNSAESILKEKSNAFVEHYSRIKETTVIYKFVEFFSENNKSSNELSSKSSTRGNSNFIILLTIRIVEPFYSLKIL